MGARRSVAAAGLLAALSCCLVACDSLEDGAFEPLFGDDESLLHAGFGSVSLSGNDSDPIIVEVPANATSLAFVISGLGSTLAQPATIKSPDGETVFEVGVNRTNRADAFPHVSTALVPVNPDVKLSEGDWEFVLFAAGNTDAEVEAVIRVDGKPSSGTLDLNLHFVGLEEIDASSAEDSAEFQAVIDAVASVYSGAGITIGDKAYFDVSDDKFAVLSTSAVGSDELLDLLETHTSDRDNRALNLFFVADIENPGSSRSLLGVSGGVAGPGPLHGTKRSGVAVNMGNFLGALEGAGDMDEAKAELQLIVSHEIGHYLGLFHTTEANGLALGPATGAALNGEDPLSDTPLCADDADANGDATLTADECSGSGGNNLMFWSPPNGATTLSSSQKEILRRNPVVR